MVSIIGSHFDDFDNDHDDFTRYKSVVKWMNRNFTTRCRKMRFYTTPPTGIQYPYVLTNIRHKSYFFKEWIEHAILDAGVMVFIQKKTREYPKGYFDTYFKFARMLPTHFWVTIPDYPDDYHPGNIPQNIEKTNENIRKYLKDDLNYLPVIQAKFPKQDSFLKNCKEVRALIGNYPRVAIGTVCKCEDLTFIRFCLQKARKYFPKTHIHAFGLTLKALPDALKFIDSFDSCAYTFPRGRGRGSCKTKVERVEFFHAYLNRIDEITTNEELKWKYQTTLS